MSSVGDRSDGWRIDSLDPSKSSLLLPLFDTVWPFEDSHAKDIEWAFGDERADSLVLVAEAGDKPVSIVGARGSISWPLQSGNAGKLVTRQFHGTCVHPDYRRLGVFTELNRAFVSRFQAEGGDAIFNVSVADSRAGYEKIGWHYLPGLRRLILPVRPLQLARAAMVQRGEMRGTPVASSSAGPPPAFESVAADLHARRELIGRRFASDYVESFYDWRFSRGHGAYRFFSNASRGTLVYKMGSRATLRELLIGDIWLRNSSVLDLAAMIWSLVRSEGPDLVSVLATRGHPLHRKLRSIGFIPDPKGDLNLGVRPLTSRGEELLDADRWALMTADIDTF